MEKKSIHYSKIGYDVNRKKVALLRIEGDATPVKFNLFRITMPWADKEVVFEGDVKLYGEKWGATWYTLDFTDYNKSMVCTLGCTFSDGSKMETPVEAPVDIGNNLLWHRTWHAVSLEQLDIRQASAYVPEGGWRDCGSPLQEVSSHLIMIGSLCDLIECKHTPLDAKERAYKHLCVGSDYVCKCQDKAKELGFGDGCVVHEIRENLSVSSGNCARTAAVLARVALTLKGINDEASKKYEAVAIKAYNWICENGPVIYTDESDWLQITHGSLEEFHTPPKQFMTRDILSLSEASLYIAKLGHEEYKEKALDFAKQVIDRQVPQDKSEEGLYGHFYTFSGFNFTEKANLHCGAWNLQVKNYNQGAHMPFWILPLMEIAKTMPETEIGKKCDETIKNFVYGFLIPAMGKNPFGIIPAGYYLGQGLLNFSGWYHGHNKMYGFATALCMHLYEYLGDEKLKDSACDNLQWLSGCNSGVEENGEYVSKSFVVGVGSVYHDDWNHLRGTVINGFDANKQFSIHPVEGDKDFPCCLDDEGGIHHSSGYLVGLCAYMD